MLVSPSARRLPSPTMIPFLLALSVILPAADQPQWGERHSRNMVSPETGLADTFDPETGENIRWVIDLGTRSYGTPIVASGRILIGSNNGRPRDPRHEGDRGVLMCFDRDDGKFLWQLVVPKVSEDRFQDWEFVGIVSPPTVEGDRVYTLTNRGEVLCLDLDGQTDGNDGPFREEGRYMSPKGQPPLEVKSTDADIVWRFDTVGVLGVRLHDETHCSVLADGPFLYICTSNGVDGTHKYVVSPEAPSLVVLEKATGRLVAQDDVNIGPNIVHCTWSSPSLGVVNGRRLIFFGGGDGICYAFDALDSVPTGPMVKRIKDVWRFDCDPEGPRGNLRKYQDNRKVGPSNITGMPVFHEGRVYVASGGDLWHGKPKTFLKCIDASKTGDVTKTGLVWSAPLVRHCMSTAAVRDGLVYIADCGRTVHCIDAKTGESVRAHRTRGDIWASPLVADGKVYIGTRRGNFWIFSASREFKVLSEIRVGNSINATVTASDGVLYLATMDKLFAIEKGARGAVTTGS